MFNRLGRIFVFSGKVVETNGKEEMIAKRPPENVRKFPSSLHKLDLSVLKLTKQNTLDFYLTEVPKISHFRFKMIHLELLQT